MTKNREVVARVNRKERILFREWVTLKILNVLVELNQLQTDMIPMQVGQRVEPAIGDHKKMIMTCSYRDIPQYFLDPANLVEVPPGQHQPVDP